MRLLAKPANESAQSKGHTSALGALHRRWRYPLTCHGNAGYVQWMAPALGAQTASRPLKVLLPVQDRPIDVLFAGWGFYSLKFSPLKHCVPFFAPLSSFPRTSPSINFPCKIYRHTVLHKRCAPYVAGICRPLVSFRSAQFIASADPRLAFLARNG